MSNISARRVPAGVSRGDRRGWRDGLEARCGMNGKTCTACGMALFSDAACYGDLRAPLCLACYLETGDLIRLEARLDRATDWLMERQIWRELWEDLSETQATVQGKLAARQRQPVRRQGIGPMLPLGADHA